MSKSMLADAKADAQARLEHLEARLADAERAKSELAEREAAAYQAARESKAEAENALAAIEAMQMGMAARESPNADAAASSIQQGASPARRVGQLSPAQAQLGSPRTAAEVATLYEALEQAMQSHAEELRVCEAERLARVAAEQMLSEREAATKSMLAARDGELARMHEQILRLHEQLDSAHAALLAMQNTPGEKARSCTNPLH